MKMTSAQRRKMLHAKVEAEPRAIWEVEPNERRVQEKTDADDLYWFLMKRLSTMTDRSRRTASEEAITSDVSSSVREAANQRMLCRTSSNVDVCSRCDAGERGAHYPWDEVEMMKHGWMDWHGHHWGRVEPKDELQLLHCGLVDPKGEHRMLIADKDPSLKANAGDDGPGHVHFCKERVEVDIPENEVDINRDSRTEISLNDGPSPSEPRTTSVAGGGRLTRISTKSGSVAVLESRDRILYLERNPTESFILLARPRNKLRTEPRPPSN